MPKTEEELAAEAAAKKESETETIESLQAKLTAAQADVDKWKELSRKNEGRATENADKAKRFDDLEEANKTEQQKLIDRAEKAEAEVAKRDAAEKVKSLAAEVAKAKSVEGRVVPASALRGSTREELEAHADEILALLPEPAKAPSADGQGKTGGAIGDGEQSAEDIVAEATKR